MKIKLWALSCLRDMIYFSFSDTQNDIIPSDTVSLNTDSDNVIYL